MTVQCPECPITATSERQLEMHLDLGHRPLPQTEDKWTRYWTAVEGATSARRVFSEAFLLHKHRDPKKPLTDREAEHRAYIECGAERDMAEARLEVARSRLLGSSR